MHLLVILSILLIGSSPGHASRLLFALYKLQVTRTDRVPLAKPDYATSLKVSWGPTMASDAGSEAPGTFFDEVRKFIRESAPSPEEWRFPPPVSE